MPVLALRRRRVCQRITARIVIELVLADIRIHRQQRMRIKRVLVAGSDVPRQHALALILSQLIVIVRNLDPVARREEVQMNRVHLVGLKIEAIEYRLIVAFVVERREFWRIEKSSAARPIERQKVTHLLAAESPGDVAAHGAETSVIAFHTSELPHRSEARSGGDLIYQARLIAEFRRRRTGDERHAFNSTGG